MKKSGRLLLGACASLASLGAVALPLDDVSLDYRTDGIVATIRLTSPVQYRSHFPEKSGNTLEIFYDHVPGAPADEVWTDNEVRNSPPSGLIPGFSVTTRDQATKPKLVIQFTRDAQFSVSMGKDNRSLLVTIRPDKAPSHTVALPNLPTIKPEVVSPAGAVLSPADANLADNNKQGRALMVQGRDALSAGKNDVAVDALNKLLLLPPNDYSQDAQEWIGVARERSGQFDKAKLEYDLYLRLYAEGEGVARVSQRLNSLAGKNAGQGIATDTGDRKQEARWMTFGSVSSHYYYGRSKIDSTQMFNNVSETITTSLTDQSMLITTEDVSGRYVSDEYDGKLVFRGANTSNFLSNKPSLNRLNSMYGELKGRKQDFLVRVGRQSSMGGGVMGRFDGLAGSYGDAQDVRVNGVAGVLADYSQGTKPTFFGASVDSGAFSVYGINQMVDGQLDRRAVGTEWRYFEDKKTAFAMVDYDANFNALNAAQFMGMMKVDDVSWHFMTDHRKTPSLSIRNVLNGATVSSVSTLLQTMSASSLRDLALARTATSDLVQVGATMPLAGGWQAGGDMRLSQTTGLAASGTLNTAQGFLAAIPSRGLEKSITGQVIGSGLVMEGDIWSASATFNTSSVISGNSIFFYNHTQFKDGWGMDSTLQFMRQTDQFGSVTTRASPMIRGSYRIQDQLTIDADMGFESTKNQGASVSTGTTRFFTSAGVRWDF